jgi:hypothetical protein
MSENTVVTDSLGKRVDRLTALVKAQANRRPGLVRYALAAVATAGLLGAGFEGYRFFHGNAATEVKPAAAVESLKADEVVKTSMKIESAYVTSSGLVLLNSMRNFRDPGNVTVVLPSGSGYTRESKNALIGKTFAGEVTKGSYQGKAQLVAVAGKWSVQ